MKPILLALSLIVALLSGCASAPHAGETLSTSAQVDLDRYMGRWYVIANIPYFAEKGNVGSYVEYSRRDDGGINDLYFYREKTFIPEIQSKAGIAKVVPDSGNARWRVSFFWPVVSDYVILYVDPDYRYAVIGHPSRDYAWIFARDLYIGDETYQQLLEVLTRQGYDASRLLKIPQRPEYLGLPGYQ